MRLDLDQLERQILQDQAAEPTVEQLEVHSASVALCEQPDPLAFAHQFSAFLFMGWMGVWKVGPRSGVEIQKACCGTSKPKLEIMAYSS